MSNKGVSKIFEGMLNLKRKKYMVSIPCSIRSKNRINSQGDEFEEFISRCISNSLDIKNYESYVTHINSVFSYIGNSVSPPDLILKDGPAIEIKHTKPRADIQLNSSYPKITLFKDDPAITKKCRDCEHFDKKDFWYILGNVKKNKIEYTFFLEGKCYFAKEEIYKNAFKKVSAVVPSTSATRELGRIANVDPLGRTSLRVRSMWLASHPLEKFDFLEGATYSRLVCTEETYNSLSKALKQNLENFFDVQFIKIKNPNNPSKEIGVYLLEDEIQ